MRICAAAPRMVHAENQQDRAARCAAGSACDTGTVAVVLKRSLGTSKQNSRVSGKMRYLWIKTKRTQSSRTRSRPQPAPLQQAGAAARLYRGVDRHHHPAAVRHHHAGAGVRDPHRLHGRHAAGRRSSAGGQAGLRARRDRSPSTFCRTSEVQARRHHRVPLPGGHQADLREARHRRAGRPHPPREQAAHPQRHLRRRAVRLSQDRVHRFLPR